MHAYGGTVVSGVGGAAPAAAKDNRLDLIEEETGLRCVPGTLNVHLGLEVDLRSAKPIKLELVPAPPAHLGPARIYTATLTPDGQEGATRCVVFRHDGTQLKDTLEVMAESKLRKTLGLEYGDRVSLLIR